MKQIIALLVLVLLIAGCNDDVKISDAKDGMLNSPEKAIADYQLAIRTLNADLYLNTVSSGIRAATQKTFCDQWKSKQECLSSCSNPGVFSTCEELCGESCDDYVNNRLMNELANTDISIELRVKDVVVKASGATAEVEVYSVDYEEATDVVFLLEKEGNLWKIKKDWLGVVS